MPILNNKNLIVQKVTTRNQKRQNLLSFKANMNNSITEEQMLDTAE